MVLESLRYGWSSSEAGKWESAYRRFLSYFVDQKSEQLVEELRPTRKTLREFESAYMAPGARVAAVLRLRTGQSIRVTEGLLQRHMYVQGSIGSGKTTLLRALLRELLARRLPTDKFVVFDPKGDYLRFVKEAGYPYVVVSEDAKLAPVRWNIFAEILGNSKPEFRMQSNAVLRALMPGGGRPTFADLVAKKDVYMRLRRVSQTLIFARANMGGDKAVKSDPYFSQNAPASVMEGVLGSLILDAAATERGFESPVGMKSEADLNNRLLSRVALMSDDAIRRLLATYQANEALSHIKKDSPPQAMGVLSTWRMYVKDVFTLEFAEPGTWSITRELHDPSFRVVLLEYRLDNEKVAIPVFSAILNSMMDEVLSTRLRGRSLYIILDEMHALPKLESLHTFLNMARDLGGKVIAATQSVAQLNDKYGEQEAKAIISAFNTRVFLRTTDDASLKLVNDTLGRLLVRRYSKSVSSGRGKESGGVSVSHTVEQKEVSAMSLSTLPPGMGILWTTGGVPILAPFAQ